jgi:hypothetical protein
MNYIRFYVFWLLANAIGFIAGSYLGATNNGLIPVAISGYPGLILGDLIFGATFGLAQWLVFRLTGFMRISSWWIGLTSLGFMLGARSGSLLTYRVIDLHALLQPSLVFGIFMGGSIGLTTVLVLHRIIAWKYLVWWLSVSALAWVLGESIAFDSNFLHETVPQVALTISSVTGLELMRHRYFSTKEKQVLDNVIH